MQNIAIVMCLAPPTAPRKRKRRDDEEDLSHELGLRVQSLEALLRSSGSLINPDQAHTAAHDTVRDAHKAAKAGSADATHVLAQLSHSVEGLSRGAQSNLLLDVLQQLTQASMRPLSGSGGRTDKKGLEVWSTIPIAAQETTVAVTAAFEADEVLAKMIISDPGLRDDTGNYFIPPTVKYIENKIRGESLLNMDVLPTEGHAPFLNAGLKFAYGPESYPYKQKRIAAIQGVSLTGGLRLAATFLSRFPPTPEPKTVFIPSPSTDEDVSALQDAGLVIRSFRFLDKETGGVDWESVKNDLRDAPAKSLIFLHVGGSAPSGAELTTNQWRLLSKLMQEREIIPLVIMAYQGLSTGDTNRDAQALRFMVHEGIPVVCVQSFETLMGLYADSPSIVSVVTRNTEDKERVDSQLRAVARAMWVHPSPFGARIAHRLLTDERVFPSWLKEIKLLSDRLRSARMKLHMLLTEKLQTPGNWMHIKKTAGMYCTALLPPEQAEALTNKHHIHLLPESCFNLGSLNAAKIELLSRAIDNVVREGIREAEEAKAQRIAMELALAAAREQQIREDVAREEERQAAAMQAVRDEDTLLMERSIANALERQQREEEEEMERQEERRKEDEQRRRAREREEIARQAEAILATI
ncbi:uncharacterized protein L203_102101 [Cryptococcus depauperatus CBS 7841]|uniref:Aminotransferase class I/classII large domain-containing protein n=1 Tax=Cryptococcus depauperatus CBS 7841 TaxID=1295531 RepID=A0AAJ8M0T1_9TREE